MCINFLNNCTTQKPRKELQAIGTPYCIEKQRKLAPQNIFCNRIHHISAKFNVTPCVCASLCTTCR